jgi:hypothetical protein
MPGSAGAGRKTLCTQTGIGGLQKLNLVPRYLIVPAARETPAEDLLACLSRND